MEFLHRNFLANSGLAWPRLIQPMGVLEEKHWTKELRPRMFLQQPRAHTHFPSTCWASRGPWGSAVGAGGGRVASRGCRRNLGSQRVLLMRGQDVAMLYRSDKPVQGSVLFSAVVCTYYLTLHVFLLPVSKPWAILVVAVSGLWNFSLNRGGPRSSLPPRAPRTHALTMGVTQAAWLSVIVVSDDRWKTQLPALVWWGMITLFHGTACAVLLTDTFCF